MPAEFETDRSDESARPTVGVSQEGGGNRMDVLFFLAFLVIWFALQWWILPRLGVPT